MELFDAASKGDVLLVEQLVSAGQSISATDDNDKTALMLTAEKGHLDVVRFLLERGANVDGSDNDGNTPIMCAAEKGHLDVVRFLLEHGATVDGSDNKGMTLIMWAAFRGHLDVVRFLLEHGATVDGSDNKGKTPIMCAAEEGHLDVVRFLLEHGATVDGSDNDGNTPIMCAAEKGHLDVVRFLLEHGAAVDGSDNDGNTPIMCAAEEGHLDVVRFLVERGANPNLKSTSGRTALSSAADFGRQEVIQFLLPLIRYQDRRTQMKHLDGLANLHSNIPSSWVITPFDVEVEPYTYTDNIGGDYRGKWLDADVVVKLFVDDTTSATFDDEVRLWHQLRHPNILKLYGICNSHHRFFVCEYASKGSLPEYLKSCDDKHRTPWKFLHEAALGLEYLHERKIVHGNLRGRCILIGSDGLAKLSGFTLSASLSERIWNVSGSLMRWAAPEILNGKEVSFASDVYSLGMCIIEAVSRRIPYDTMSESDVQWRVRIRALLRNIQLDFLTREQRDLVLAMCSKDPRKRLQMPAVVNKLEWFAEMEAAKAKQHTAQPEPFVNFDDFDELNQGKTKTLWIKMQTLVAQSENGLYRQIWHELEFIYDTLKSETHPWSTLKHFHNLLSECRVGFDTMSQQNWVCRLSATQARDHSVQGLHRRITQLLQLVLPQDQDAETRETEWKRLCSEKVEVFVSEASEAYVLLSSVDSEEDRLALVAVLRAELRNSDDKYTEKQLVVLQKTYDDIMSTSLEDVQHVAAPEWFIPWFELEMNEMVKLGEGGFGSVIKAKWLDSEAVVKKLEIDAKDAVNAEKKREMRQMFEREVDIWFGLSHPHVVRLFGACHVGRPFFVCELATNGTLVEYLRDHSDELWSKLHEAALGVQYLHARGIVHGDLKGNNILIGSDGKAKVTDFGLSNAEMVTGAWHWVAPECILGQKPTFMSDIYSLGMCIIEALRVTNGDEYTLPWGNLPNSAVKFHVTKRHLLPPRPKNCSDEAWTLIERMCKSEPADRILIMTVVDELEKLADRHENQITDNIDKSVTDTLAEMNTRLANCDTKTGDEGDVLKMVYQLLWNRLEHVVARSGEIKTNSDFRKVVEDSRVRTYEALDITGVIPLVKYTELALRGYALHRRLDKFMAAHTIVADSNPLHDWKSACSTYMEASASLTQTKLASATEVAAAS